MTARHVPLHAGFAAHRLERLLPLPDPQTGVFTRPVRVLVAGDHAGLRSSLKTMLELDPNIHVIGEAADDCEMVKCSWRLKPDVVLLDLDMRCCDGFDAIAEITRKKLAAAVVALTIHNEEAEKSLAQAAGVNLLLEKGVPYKQLISAIRLAAANTLRR